MRRLAVAATIAALTLIGGQASAATTLRYAFTSYVADPSADPLADPELTGSFVALFDYDGYFAVNPVGSGVTLDQNSFVGVTRQLISCNVDGFACGDQDSAQHLEFYTDTLITGPVHYDVVDFSGHRGEDVFTQPFFFASGAFSHLSPPGGYQSLVFDGMQATLTVSSVVPEPAAWALLITGVAAAGVALRTQRRQPATVKA